MTPPRWLWPVVAAAVLLSLAAAGQGVLPGDVAVARGIQGAIPAELRALVGAVNWLGRAVPGAIGVTLVVALLLVRRGHRTAAGFVALTLPLRLVNPGLKALVDSPRPEGTLISVSERAAGFGFPSGHATGAMLLYGAVILIAPFLTASPHLRAAVRLVAAAMILVAGLCRVEVGAHWPSDVVGGYLWGGMLLGLLVSLRGCFGSWGRHSTLQTHDEGIAIDDHMFYIVTETHSGSGSSLHRCHRIAHHRDWFW